VVVELLDHCWRWIDAVVGVLSSSYGAQKFLDVDLYDEIGEGSIIVQVLNIVLEAAVQERKAKVGTVDD
jgi:hypothetical protein